MNESPESEPRQSGVISHRIENNHHVAMISWAGGETSELHWPTHEIKIIDPVSHKEIGRLSDAAALVLLSQHAAKIKHEEFSWAKLNSIE